jgi:hypothetical protein
MMEKIKKMGSRLIAQVKAGIDWLKDSWPTIQAQAEKMARRLYEVAVNHVRKAVLCFNRGVVVAIETAERRQAMPFHRALAEAKSVVKAMNDEQVSAYAAFWFRQEKAATGTA